MQNSQGAALRTMVARVSPDDIVIYANGALASYLGVSKKKLIGTPLDVLAKRSKGEISTCFARPESGRANSQLVTDDQGRVFEAKLYSEGGVLDIILDEVTSVESFGRELRDSSGSSFESFSEEELRTARYPERRYLTVSRIQLRNLSQFTDRLAPMEVRLMVNSFVEEACDAIFDTGCTVGETSGDSILGVFGAPRYFTDHPLRAILAACDQMRKAAQLHAGFYREGKELPPCSCGIWTGDSLVGTLGNSIWQHYTVIGAPVDLATRLCQLARSSEILLPEHTLTHLLRTLPEGWQHVRAESEFEPDLSDFQWSGDEIAPLPENLKKVVYLIGPNVQQSTENVELYFDYMWAFRVPGRETPVPILRVVRPTQIGDSLELRDDNVVTTQAVQTLGKYKLIEVLGSGGMGKVWRSVDRFGNSVAIKVLHSSEGVTDVQLRRFRREAEVMAKLPHRNICRVYEMNEFDGIQFIAMEFVDGLPLSDLLYEKTEAEESGQATGKIELRALIHSLKSVRSRAGQSTVAEGEEEPEAPPRPKNTRILPIEQTLSIILKVSDAVQFAHEHGVLHRDLKPGNILLREDGEPLVADFGLAKMNSADATHSLSISGHVVGTLENMSPEQAESSKDVDERADVYSIGTMLYQMLTGRRHFEATGNIVADAQALKTHEPIRPRAHNPQIDSDLEIITLKALRNDPNERYRNVAALEADIQRYRRGEVISARPVHIIEIAKKLIQRNKGVSAGIAACFLIMILGVIVVIWQQSASISKQKRLNAEKSKVLQELQDNKALVEHQKMLVDEKTRELELKTQSFDKEKSIFEAQLSEIADKATKATLAEKSARIAEESATAAKKELEEALNAANAATEGERKESDRLKNALARATNESNRTPRWRPGDPNPPGGRDFLQQGGPGGREPAMEAFNRANQVFFLETSPEALEKRPDEITRNLSIALDHVSQALTISADLYPAWMLKGRIHLALMEFPRALESFNQAVKYADKHPEPAAQDPATAMVTLTNQLNALRFSSKYSDGALTLTERTQPPPNQHAGALLKVLAENAKNKLASSPRLMTGNEAALEIVLRNPLGTQVFVRQGSSRPEIFIWGGTELTDLTPLKETNIASLSINSAQKLDWATVVSLPNLEALDLTNCNLESFFVPPQRNFPDLKSLTIARTHIASLDFLRFMTGLEKLNITESDVVDLSPLIFSRSRLRELQMGGLNPANLRILLNLNVESITLSPMLVLDKLSLYALRQHPRLKVLRSPDDPEAQSPAEFWRKLDTGFYQTSQ